MAAFSNQDFEDWVCENNLSKSTEDFIISHGYNSIYMLNFLSSKVIDESNLTRPEKNHLKHVLELINAENDEQSESENNNVQRCSAKVENKIIEKNDNIMDVTVTLGNRCRWKEFGYARHFEKWKKDYYPVELFSPDGFWAWNAASKSLLFGTNKIDQVWRGFNDNSRGWLMSPPVLLPCITGPFKLIFNFRLNNSEENDVPFLECILVNDIYNKRLLKYYTLPLKFSIRFNFINVSTGIEIGSPIEDIFIFEELHSSYNLGVPENVLVLDKPPIISVKVDI